MEVLLTKSQKAGMMGLGAISFVLNIKARLTEEESALVKKYKMGKLIVYDKNEGMLNTAQSDGGWKGLAAGLALKAFKMRISIDDLVNGRTIEIKDIEEMMAAQMQIKEAAQAFHQMLMASKGFEGEEVLKFE